MLKLVKVSSTYFRKDEFDHGHILTNIDEFLEYFEIEDNKSFNEFFALVRDHYPINKMDHVEGTIGFAASLSKVTSEPILIEMSNIMGDKKSNIFHDIMAGHRIFINRNGGYHNFTDETHTILKTYSYYSDKREHVSIALNPTILNLENDSKPEKYVEKFFKDKNIEPSYILNLRSFNKDELTVLLERFKRNGGHTVYVYTTGFDHVQMKEYIEAIMDAYIHHLIIELNQEPSEDTKSVIEFAENNISDFTIIYQK